MLCQNCQKRTATVHVERIVNQKKEVMNLCSSCAAEKGVWVDPFESTFGVGDLFDTFFSSAKTEPQQALACPKCGLSYHEFLKQGKFGCGDCYFAFSDPITKTLKRIHGTSAHVGKVPKAHGGEIRTQKDLEMLRNRLITAISKEEYEKAAELRDQIKALEKGEGGQAE